jgi:hypothetical protein
MTTTVPADTVNPVWVRPSHTVTRIAKSVRTERTSHNAPQATILRVRPKQAKLPRYR